MLMSESPYLENKCLVCGGPQLGVHYHEENVMEDSWDTEEAERWMMNDEGLYRQSEEMRDEISMELLFRELYSELDIDYDNVDWYVVFQTRMGM